MDEMKETDDKLDSSSDGFELSAGIEKNLFKAGWMLTAGLVNIPLQKIERHLAEKKADSDARIAETKADSDARIAETKADSDARIAETKADSDARIMVTHTVAQRISEQLNVSEEFVTLAATKFFGNIVQEQLNLDSIFEKAQLSLHNTPQDETNTDQNIGEISDDWLNEFRGVACKKSSQEAHELFSKVLAGEIRKPGAFSLFALTTLANMDQEVVQLFNKFCSLCIVYLEDPNEFLQSDSYFNIKDVRIPFLTGDISDAGTIEHIHPSIIDKFNDRSDSIYKEYGFGFKEIQLLKDLRLIESSSLMYYNYILYNNELWIVTLPTPHTPFKEEDIKDIEIAGYALTSVGRELFHLTERDTPPEYWDTISEFLKDYYDVKLCKFPNSQKKSSSNKAD